MNSDQDSEKPTQDAGGSDPSASILPAGALTQMISDRTMSIAFRFMRGVDGCRLSATCSYFRDRVREVARSNVDRAIVCQRATVGSMAQRPGFWMINRPARGATFTIYGNKYRALIGLIFEKSLSLPWRLTCRTRLVLSLETINVMPTYHTHIVVCESRKFALHHGVFNYRGVTLFELLPENSIQWFHGEIVRIKKRDELLTWGNMDPDGGQSGDHKTWFCRYKTGKWLLVDPSISMPVVDDADYFDYFRADGVVPAWSVLEREMTRNCELNFQHKGLPRTLGADDPNAVYTYGALRAGECKLYTRGERASWLGPL